MVPQVFTIGITFVSGGRTVKLNNKHAAICASRKVYPPSVISMQHMVFQMCTRGDYCVGCPNSVKNGTDFWIYKDLSNFT